MVYSTQSVMVMMGDVDKAVDLSCACDSNYQWTLLEWDVFTK